MSKTSWKFCSKIWAISSFERLYISTNSSKTNFKYIGSFGRPLRGVGVKYGLSVSNRIEVRGISFKTSLNLEFLKVKTPPIPSLYPN